MVNQFGSNDSFLKPTSSQDNSATIGSIPTTHVEMSNALEKMNDAQEEMRSSTREASTLQKEDLSPVKERNHYGGKSIHNGHHRGEQPKR
ncbi:LOW QUALITY PROTEIN: hypothetical protein HID58_056968 [Brassica napus]|uniref:Uncharacterized protein n=1 Tax=Brassica napus TaxID=3708 RepID=A0ABQ8APR9_BRANA|nr:LOW QUALITY PROTEIN: hypothetical protein HID58_056968 [Brassica napus]